MKIVLVLIFLLFRAYGEPITPIPQVAVVDKQKAELGKELFFDTTLSKDNSISCATCHNLETGGDDNLKFSFGVELQEGDINSPTVFNAVYNFRQFWNGSAKDLAHQAMGPVENPIEMANTFENVVATLKKNHYKKKFNAIYEDGVTKENIVDAIAEFEKTLITPNSPFDKYLRGDKSALSQDQIDGYNIFKTKGCIACHHGINIGGSLYSKFGVVKDLDSKRLGRYEVTKKEEDKFYFKVPTLRNIALTAPYMHDGRFENLEDAVKLMANYQLGRTITQEEVEKIVEFLKSLTGEIPQSAKK